MIEKNISLGKDNFKEIIEDNNYYVDKSLFIKELIRLDAKVSLITRPRRFGKTLNMSMLQYYFERKEIAGKDYSYLFDGLKISKSEDRYLNEQGKYPVIYLTLKNAKLDNWEGTYEELKEVISNEYLRHNYLLDSDLMLEEEKEKFKKIINKKAKDIDYRSSILYLAKFLNKYFNEQAIILIDEYDTPIQSGYLNGYFEEVLEFMKNFLVKIFKDNKALKRGVLTGIMKVAKESIFSDFNNPLISTVLSYTFQNHFGFTEDEIDQIISDYNLEDSTKDLKEWYNGYIFGGEVIYNPWSILNYVLVPVQGFKSYWLNSSENAMVKELLRLNQVEGKKTIEKLLENEKVTKNVSENIVYQNITKDFDATWSFLLHGGYLKAENMRIENYEMLYDLSIPNKEVSMMYRSLLKKYFEEDIKLSFKIESFVKSLLDKDLEKFSRVLKSIYLSHVSYYDVSNLKEFEEIDEVEQDIRYENFHHGYILGLLMYSTKYFKVDSNKEYGLGRPDIVLIPKDRSKSAYIFEFKWSSTQSSKTLDQLVKSAKNQIVEKQYVKGVKTNYGVKNIYTIAIGFKGKNLKIDIEK